MSLVTLHPLLKQTPARWGIQALCAAILCALLCALSPRAAQAATINVDGITCTLPAAIEAANTDDTSAGGCTFNGLPGDDTLLLIATTYTLSSGPYSDDGPSATPSITTTITISATGSNVTTIARDGATQYRLFHIGNGGNLTLAGITLLNGNSASDGGAIYNRNRLTLIDSAILSNTAQGNGGGLYNTLGASAAFSATNVISNTAANGGGLYNAITSTVALTNTNFYSNVATADGGAIYNSTSSTLTLNGASLHANRATATGGAILNSDHSAATLTASQLYSNTAFNGGALINLDHSSVAISGTNFYSNSAYSGGALSNLLASSAQLTNTILYANRAQGNGGGLYNAASLAAIHNSQLLTNTAILAGGAIYNDNGGKLTLTASTLRANSAQNGGGYFGTPASTATAGTTQWLSNTATSVGGALNNSGTLTLTTSSLLANRAATGSVLAQTNGATTLDQSCIVNNSDKALTYVNGSDINAAHNWWGAADGPSGVAPGSGDSITTHVTIAPFLTSAPSGCPPRTSAPDLNLTTSAGGALLPGQPITLTVAIANDSDNDLYNLHLAEQFGPTFHLDHLIPSPLFTAQGSNRSLIAHIPPHTTASQSYAGIVIATLTANSILTHTATITQGLPTSFQAQSSNPIYVPLLNWTAPTYNANENATDYNVYAQLSFANPFAAVTAQALISGQITQTLTFAPSNALLAVPIDLNDDSTKQGDRTLLLTMQNGVGARISSPNPAHLIIHDNESDLSLQATKLADGNQAQVGETIRYSYRITNTSSVVLDIVAIDDKLGHLPDLEGLLGPGGSANATMSHLVTDQDLANEPLFNTLIVTGTGTGAGTSNIPIIAAASASVHITPRGQSQGEAPRFDLTLTAVPDVAQVGDVISLTYKIHNTGLVTITKITATLLNGSANASATASNSAGPTALTLTTPLLPGKTTTGVIPHQVTIHDLPSPVEKDVQVTAQAGGGQSTTQTASTIISMRLILLRLPQVLHK